MAPPRDNLFTEVPPSSGIIALAVATLSSSPVGSRNLCGYPLHISLEPKNAG